MLAFRVTVNDTSPVVLGQADWSILSAILSARRTNQSGAVDDEIELSLGGLSDPSSQGYPEHFRHPETGLTVGDRIQIDVIETDDPDHPLKRYRSDKEVQESPYTDEEWREMEYRDYLELKTKFEDKTSQ